MIQKLSNRFIAAKRDERGSGELIAFLFAFPVVWFLLMSMIDVSIWLSVKGQVQNASDNAARLAALYGSADSGVASWPVRGQKVENVAIKTIYNGSRCTLTGSCPNGYTPNITCWFGDSDTNNGVRRAATAGTRVTCVARYKFHQVVQGDIFGFVGITTNEFTTKSYQFSETGFGG